ncbi:MULTISPECIES: PfkB family carbohydrate kinase [unclassified Herbaspirillum]|uniref:PfkB family carbohydrate kinase n=1 Tax=unclassified Herbaspirillum TaxID=2624150 RepID=UPI000E2FC641|nr:MULTISPECIES: PfkB family carbohydrate kinase [unclassified Herbaspirillum]RFB71081.1 ADP-heptose synthase [Herbaspirillum sp. 3R-3a1]TFI08395.1 ADP-heptose synthase [Herbaspirillum sp. 3R11]TFI14810.1 ADP-heptose synthase [Herbaspirillum sp. 3R-11]TFI29398.1 ADP-heptose synthase [Herbaspirillum sp. 3C11]
MDSSSFPHTADIAEIKARAGAAARIVFVAGNFNTVHPGHLRLLKFASDCGDFLVVGVAGDHVPGALLPAKLRFDGITAIGFVDYAFVMNAAPEDIIRVLQPTIVVKGDEYEAKNNPEQAAVDEYGGKLMFSSGEMRFSSFDLLKRDILEPNLSSIIRPQDYLERHGFSMRDLRATMEKFKGFRVTVIGDLIVDEYVNCEALGMSQEDPTLVVTPILQNRFIGGAGIVASHACTLGAEVSYFSVAGTDVAADFAREKLQEYNVAATIFDDDSRPTTLKQRFRAAGKTLLRVSHLRQHDIEPKLARRFIDKVKSGLAACDLVIFSDFNYGCLPQAVVDELITACVERNIPFVADSQSSSQMGDVSRFKGAMLLTPTEREARLAIRDYNSGLVVLAEKLRQQSRADNIILTLGAEGILVHAKPEAEGEEEWLTDRLPAFNISPKDTAGAGDSLITCTSMAMAVGADIWQSMYLGSIAAACQISRVGNIPLSSTDLMQELKDFSITDKLLASSNQLKT